MTDTNKNIDNISENDKRNEKHDDTGKSEQTRPQDVDKRITHVKADTTKDLQKLPHHQECERQREHVSEYLGTAAARNHENDLHEHGKCMDKEHGTIKGTSKNSDQETPIRIDSKETDKTHKTDGKTVDPGRKHVECVAPGDSALDTRDGHTYGDIKEQLQSVSGKLDVANIELINQTKKYSEIVVELNSTKTELQNKNRAFLKLEQQQRNHADGLSKLRSEHKNTMEELRLASVIKANELDRQNLEHVQTVSVLTEELNINRNQFVECATRWNEDCKIKERGMACIKVLHTEKVILMWKMVVKLGLKTTENSQLREQHASTVNRISAQVAQLQEELSTVASDHEIAQAQLHDENYELQNHLGNVEDEARSQVAELTARVEDIDAEKAAMSDQLDHAKFQVKKLQGSVDMSHDQENGRCKNEEHRMMHVHVWVKEMSEQCAQSTSHAAYNLMELNEARKRLEDKSQECLANLEEVDNLKRDMHNLQLAEEETERQRVMLCERVRQAETNAQERQEMIRKLQDEVDKSASTLMRQYHLNEEQKSEMTVKDKNKQRLLKDLLDLRRQLEVVKRSKGRFRGWSNGLEGESKFSPSQYSTPKASDFPDTSRDDSIGLPAHDRYSY